MSHLVHEWVTRRQVTFPVGSVANEQVVIGDPIDVGDWEEADVEVYTIAMSSGLAATDITFNVQTAISTDTFANWEAVNTAWSSINNSVDGATVLKATASSTNRMRKWLRLVFMHNVTTPSQTVTVHAWILLKKRTP